MSLACALFGVAFLVFKMIDYVAWRIAQEVKNVLDEKWWNRSNERDHK